MRMCVVAESCSEGVCVLQRVAVVKCVVVESGSEDMCVVVESGNEDVCVVA